MVIKRILTGEYTFINIGEYIYVSVYSSVNMHAGITEDKRATGAGRQSVIGPMWVLGTEGASPGRATCVLLASEPPLYPLPEFL